MKVPFPTQEVCHVPSLAPSSNAALRFHAHVEGGPLNSATALSSSPRSEVALEQALSCARLAHDNKAKDVLVLDMRGLTPIFDYFILATGTSRRQIHAISDEIDHYLQGEGEKRASIQGYQNSNWIVQDYGDLIVHVFDQDARAYYSLEELWADAPRIDWQRG